jgi:membrane protease YdiL (CAAX protease family)
VPTDDTVGTADVALPTWWQRNRDLVALVATVVVLASWNVSRSFLVPEHLGIVASLGMAVVLGGLGFLGGLRLGDLGLDRRHARAGLAWGGAVLGIVMVVMVIVGALPMTRHALDDARVHVSAATMAFEVLVAIPLGTVILEELAFRGTLLGLLMRRLPTPWAVGTMALLFGFWHVKGVLHDAADHVAIVTVLGTVVATTVAGIGFGWLRLRSQSLVAPILAHVATNSITFLVAWVVWH